MRLIDGDAITKRMIAFCDKNCPYTPKERDVMCGACFMGAAMELLEDAPTIEPERKTGRWVEIALSNHTYKCSVCGRLLVNITDGKNNVAKNYPYCHCGAYMGGDAE